MFEMNVPYDKGQMKIKLEDKNLAGVLEGRQSDYKTTLSENEIVEQSLNNPIGSKSLEELAKRQEKYCHYQLRPYASCTFKKLLHLFF